MIEQYVVRTAGDGPDLVWVAEIDFDPVTEVGEIRHAGGLDGQVDPILDRATLDGLILGFELGGAQVDRLP